MFCAFGCHLEQEPNRFQRMQEKYPKQYDFCMRSVENNGLGLARVLEYVGIPYQKQMKIDDYLDDETKTLNFYMNL